MIIFNGAIYLPTRKKAIEAMIKLLEIKPGEKIADLGAGDGRLIIAMARAGAEAHGYEINPILVSLAKRKIKKAGLEGRAFVHLKSFWAENFSQFDAIAIFGINDIMKKMEEKLIKELKSETRVVSNCFEFPNWKSSKKEDTIFLYKKEV